MNIPNEIIVIAGNVACAALGFFCAALLAHGKARSAERRAIRDMEKLFRARALQDHRDSQRLF
jgi:hypothetical protein